MQSEFSEFYNIPEVTINEFEQTLDFHLLTGQSAMLWGPPGVGKSRAIENWAHKRGYNLITQMLSQLQPTDFAIPAISDKEDKGKWYLAEWLDIPKDQTTVLFLDELSSAPSDVQQAGYQLLLDHKVSNFKIGGEGKLLVVAAGNREEDGAEVSNRMGTAQCDRLTHYQIRVDSNEWLDWAVENKLHPYVTSFINVRKDALYVDPTLASKQVAFPTPRTWKSVSDYLYAMERLGFSEEIKKLAESNNTAGCSKPVLATIAGRIGNDTMADFLTTIKEVKELYSPEEYIDALYNDHKKLKKMAPVSNTCNYGLIFQAINWANETEDISRYIDAMTLFKFFADNLNDDGSNNREEIFTAAVTIIGGQLERTGQMVRAVTNRSFLNNISDKVREINTLSDLNEALNNA